MCGVNHRDYDQETIDLEDAMCQRILRAAENQPYQELADLGSVELYETDADLSTPDRTTTNSDPEAIVSHLAEQESAFSEDGLHTGSPVSPLESQPDTSIDVALELQEIPEPSTSGMAQGSCSHGTTPDEEEQVGSRVMYHESEADTSCVVDMEEDEEPGVSEPRRVTMDRDHGAVGENYEEDEDEDEEDAEEYAEGDIISLDSSTGSYSRMGDSKLSTV